MSKFFIGSTILNTDFIKVNILPGLVKR